jgi:hypothetical protein
MDRNVTHDFQIPTSVYVCCLALPFVVLCLCVVAGRCSAYHPGKVVKPRVNI